MYIYIYIFFHSMIHIIVIYIYMKYKYINIYAYTQVASCQVCPPTETLFPNKSWKWKMVLFGDLTHRHLSRF